MRSGKELSCSRVHPFGDVTTQVARSQRWPEFKWNKRSECRVLATNGKKCRGLSLRRESRRVGLLHVSTTHRNRKFKNVSTNETPHRKRFSSQCRRVVHDFRGQVRDQNNTTQPASEILFILVSTFEKIEFNRVYGSPKDASLSCRIKKIKRVWILGQQAAITVRTVALRHKLKFLAENKKCITCFGFYKAVTLNFKTLFSLNWHQRCYVAYSHCCYKGASIHIFI